MPNQSQEQHKMGILQGLSIVIGVIIGSGIFLKPSTVLQSAGTPAMALLAWGLGGLVTLASALSISEIASAIPESGGLYLYLQRLYGDVWGFLLGWVQTIISYPASVAALAIAFATNLDVFIPLSPSMQKVVALGILFFLVGMNILSTRCGGAIQVLSTIGKLIPMAAIIFFGLFAAPDLESSTTGAVTATGFGAAMLGTLWAYDGWIGVTNMAGELKNPSKSLPKVIAIGVSAVVLVYVLFNWGIFQVLPYEEAVTSQTPATLAAVHIFGPRGAALLTAGIIISVVGSMNGYLMTAARVPLTMSQQGQLPFSHTLGKLRGRSKTPCNALLLEGVIAALLVLSGSYDLLTNLLVFVLWIFFTMGVFGVFLLRKKYPNREGGYRVPLYPVTPLIGIVGAIYILVSTVFSDPLQAILGIALTLVGLPVYFYLRKKRA